MSSTELAVIERAMEDTSSEYYTGLKDDTGHTRMQNRYLELQGGSRQAVSVPSTPRIREIEKLMSDKHSVYWRGEESERLQAEYYSLIGGDAEDVPGPRHTTYTPPASAEIPTHTPAGHAVSPEGKEMIGSFIEKMRVKGADPRFINEAVVSYFEINDRFIENLLRKTQKRDADAMEASLDDLRDDWGEDYEERLADVRDWVADMPTDLSRLLGTARFADGSLLGNNAELVRWLSDKATY